MKIVLLGAGGQLGRDLTTALCSADSEFELVTFDRKKLDLVQLDKIGATLKKTGFDCLINSTGHHDVDQVESDAGTAFAVNAYAVAEIASVCKSKGASFIHFSTDYVFGGDWMRTEPITEAVPAMPVNIYGSSKLMGETLAELTGARVTVLRVASLFGVGGMSGTRSNFVEKVLQLGAEGKEFRVVDDQTVSPASTSDVAAAVVQLLRCKSIPGLLHVVNSGQCTRYEFAREILYQAGMPDLVQPCASSEYPAPALRPRFSALGSGKLHSLGIPMRNWKDALNRYLVARKKYGGA